MNRRQKKENLVSAIEIIFEDEYLVVVNKPAKLLTIPDHWIKEKENLFDWLQAERPESNILTVHRLDLETSGLIVFAKSPEVHSDLCQQFEKHTIEKINFALVHGKAVEESGRIELPLGTNPKKRGTVLVQKNGKPAVTRWKALEKFQDYSFLQIEPETERLHQIRVHLRAIGHPLLVDAKYGDRSPVLLSQLKKKYIPKEEKEERPILDRLALHVGELKFTHPVTGEHLEFKCDLPKDMQIVLRNLRKYRSAF